MDKTLKEHDRFFKFFNPARNARRLKIPTAYTCYMKGNLPAKVFLRDRYGNRWAVDIKTIQSELYFVGGWSDFVQNNSLEAGDFLVFYFDGSDVFDVKILGCSCCEKVGVRGPKTRLEEEKQEYLEEEDIEVEYMEEVEEKDKESSEFTGKNMDHINEEDENAYESKRDDDDDDDNDDNGGGGDEDDENRDDDDDDEDYEDEEPIVASKNHVAIPKSSGCGRKHLKKMDCKSAQGESSAVKGKAALCKKPAADNHATEIFSSGCISPPKNPYFVTQIKKRRRNELYVPANVIKDNNLDLPSEMILRDSKGREWQTKLTSWTDGRKWYNGGWALVHVNLLKGRTRDNYAYKSLLLGTSDIWL